MSHWCSVKLAVDDETILRKALARMGLQVLNTTGKAEEVSLYNQKSQAEIVLAREGSNATVGLARQPDGTYQMVGDFWHAQETTPKLRQYYSRVGAFQEDLQAAYCIEKAIGQVEDAGFTVDENYDGVVGEDGLITMVAVCYE